MQANNIMSFFTETNAFSSPISLEPIVLDVHFDIKHHSVLALVLLSVVGIAQLQIRVKQGKTERGVAKTKHLHSTDHYEARNKSNNFIS